MSYKKNHKTKKNNSKKFIIIVIATAATALLIGIVVFYVMQKPSSQKTDVAKKLTPIERADEVSNKAQGQAALGKTDDAFKLYDEEIAKTTDKKAQAWLLVNKSTTAINAKKYSEAISFGRQAEALAASYSTSQVIAQAAQAQGDKQVALEYYKLTFERYKTEAKDLPFYESDLAGLEAKIKELSQ